MIQLEELKSKLLELKPQIDDYRSAIGMDDLLKKQQQLEGEQQTPIFGMIWKTLRKFCSRSARSRQRLPLTQKWRVITKT